ncbi:MAG: outer membrane lipoprotein carrier protein LolA [Bacteroidetes bacterium]|nr:outer membrane lipoprotein carrier protein LolA [Bacteroidota bacterium]
MKKIFSVLIAILMMISVCARQQGSAVADPEAGAMLEKATNRFKSFKSIEVDFTLTTIRPKLKPDEPDSKYTSNDHGKLWMKGNKFKISMNGVDIYCDGKTIWSYNPKTKEIQVNDYEESNETFSPTKIFSVYKEGYSYQIKEKKTFAGKNVTVIELAPQNRKVSYFKIDVGLDDATNDVLESKIYEKSGVRYIYKINKLNAAANLSDDFFVCDAKKYPGAKVVDLR